MCLAETNILPIYDVRSRSGMGIMWQDETGKWLVCCIKGCDQPPTGNGLCINHHRRNKKYGSPIASKMVGWLANQFSDEERFWQQVKKSDDCWLWLSGKDEDGYGACKFEHDGVVYKRAHRYSFALHKGAIPFGLSVCHTCDVRACIRPDHLFLGTNAVNQADKWAKGRGNVPYGETHSKAVLTEEQARAILEDARPYSQIASQYGVHVQTISSLKTRASWPHLGKEKGVKAPRVSPRKGKSDKVTPEIVRIIRSSADRGVDLAERYGIKPQDVSDIRHRRSWAHIE